MGETPDIFSMQWGQFGGAITAVGALGVAAFGVVESLGKAFAFTFSVGSRRRLVHIGLPYVGLGVVRKMFEPMRPALECAYGLQFAEIIANQYRADRGDGTAPDTIRQGVRLGLPYLPVTVASALIATVWHMETRNADALARALQADNGPSAGEQPPAVAPTPLAPTEDDAAAVALAGRFATALDARINAAFQLADERYETVAKTAAGAAAVAMSLLFDWGLADHGHKPYPWVLAIGIGIVAVPLAPVAKDLSTSLQNALTAFKSISGKGA